MRLIDVVDVSAAIAAKGGAGSSVPDCPPSAVLWHEAHMRSEVSRPRSVSPALCADAATADTIIVPATIGRSARFNIFQPACLRWPISGPRNTTLATAVQARQARILLKARQDRTPDDRVLADLGDRAIPAMVGDMASCSSLAVCRSIPRMIERDPEFLGSKAIFVAYAESRRRVVVQGGHLMVGCGRRVMIHWGADAAVPAIPRAGMPDQIVACVVRVGFSAATEGAKRVAAGNQRLKRGEVGRAAGATMAGCGSVTGRGLNMMRRR